MTKEEQINFIREKCIEVNPEIVALTFGCEGVDRYGNDWIFTGHEWYGKDKFMRAIYEPDRILGRPIRLADVLLAIQEHVNDANDKIPHEISLLRRWNLRADDLREQSAETITLLCELLK